MSSSKEIFPLSITSVSYGSVEVGLFHQERNAESNTPLESIQDFVLKMPDYAKVKLLEPIENGTIDPMSAFLKVQDSQRNGTDFHFGTFEHYYI